MFNIQGSELIFLLLIALVVLGPEKLPDAVRKFTKGYNEFKKMANGFQGELRQAFDEPLKELRDTADAVRQAATFDLNADAESPVAKEVAEPASRRDQGLDFGANNPRRQARAAEPATPPDQDQAE